MLAIHIEHATSSWRFILAIHPVCVTVQVMILSQDNDRGRVMLSTKKLEPTPGDMLNNPKRVSHMDHVMPRRPTSLLDKRIR